MELSPREKDQVPLFTVAVLGRVAMMLKIWAT
jgi:hypothetical protein